MDIIEFLFQLVTKFVHLDEENLARMKRDANKWKGQLVPESENKIEAFYAKYMRTWWAQLALAVLFLPACKWVMEWMQPDTDRTEEID